MHFPFGNKHIADTASASAPPSGAATSANTNTAEHGRQAGPPPGYASTASPMIVPWTETDGQVKRVYPYSLRPVMFFTSFLGFLWAIAMGISAIRDRSSDNETSKEKSADLILAILYFVVMGCEVFGMVVAALQSLPLARMLLVVAPLGIIVTAGDQILQIILHFTLKTDIINQCISNTVGDTLTDGFDSETIDNSEAQSLCHSSWSHGTTTVIIWLIFTSIVSLFFGWIALAYYHELLHPDSVRSRVNVPAESYAMNPPPPGGYFGAAPGQQPWMVPPYPGPPAGGHPEGGYEKSDYHPSAEWAQQQPDSLGYAPPAGPPPARSLNPFESRNERSGPSVAPNREEDEAWERARTQGVTAHLTGHAPAPPASDEEEVGYHVGRNDEEDEAWERARTEGVTAHLTGQSAGQRVV